LSLPPLKRIFKGKWIKRKRDHVFKFWPIWVGCLKKAQLLFFIFLTGSHSAIFIFDRISLMKKYQTPFEDLINNYVFKIKKNTILFHSFSYLINIKRRCCSFVKLFYINYVKTFTENSLSNL
jgi:hypothetical protein